MSVHMLIDLKYTWYEKNVFEILFFLLGSTSENKTLDKRW